MRSRQILSPKQKCLERVHFTSLKDYNLNLFLLILDLQLLDFQMKHQHGCALTAASPKNGGKFQIISHETSKMYLLQTSLYWTWNFDESPILVLLTQEEVIYLKRKLCVVANECSFEIGRIFIIRACVIKRVRPILYGAPCRCSWEILQFMSKI